MGDGSAHASVAQVSDFLLVHFNSTRLEDIPKRIASLKRYGKPIVCNEDAKEGAEGAEAAELCVPNGASWGFLLEKLNPQMFSHGWELPSRLTGEGGRSGASIPVDARAKRGSSGQYLAFVPSLDLVVPRQTASSGEWAFDEYLRRACATAEQKPKP